ncbi:polysaccharide biosynthesis/export family protein [Salipiger sp. PrR002]|uniref:polysaccharide biosynthesis/export family protein n=1 Tax=Salipiger sp. PrR002 TaxID=2706489 RepID=UPI0013BA32DF|nr:polysaccharide biosynthesis/export family protein [Salipiger sp. PrR002]NDW01860.1 hypothetical protein [Salipiger sp. PrR002]NDW57844.1 hypothetical protein [Salipiger sp. PrR004]
MTGGRYRQLKAALLAAVVGALSATAAAAEAYLLGAEDVIALRAVAWDEETASYVPMDSLTGSYKVSAEGSIMVPIVGEVRAAGQSLSDVGDDVAEALQQATGLYQPPKVALEIASYRPFYAAGLVSGPGSYAWRPGLTASKALAIAGGMLREATAAGRDAGVYRETSSLRGVQVDLMRLQARQARLEAELKGAEEITFPQGLHHPDGVEAVARTLAEEQTIFEIRREAAARGVASSKALIELYQTELAGLASKLEGFGRQMQLAKEQAENLRTLSDRGAVVVSRLVSAERTLAELSSEELDLNTAAYRARQRIGETERDLQQAQATRRQEIVTQLQEARRQIELETKRQEMFMNLVALSGLPTGEGPVEARMQVRRDGPEGVEVIAVEPDDLVLPGDVLEVSIDFGFNSQ